MPPAGSWHLRQVRAAILHFREQRDWRPGLVWDPYRGAYVKPQEATTGPAAGLGEPPQGRPRDGGTGANTALTGAWR